MAAAATVITFTGLSTDTSEAIQEWVKAQIEQQLVDRLTLASRAIEFVNNIDMNQKEVIDKVKLEADRINQIVMDFNLVKADFDLAFNDIRAKMETIYEQTQASATKAGEEAKFVHDEVTQLGAKTQLFADQTIAELNGIKLSMNNECEKLRADVTTWSNEYAKKVEAMVQTGNFSHENGPPKNSTAAGKMDKKEVSV